MKHFIHLFLVSFLLANLCSVNAVAENTPKTATSSENTMIAATEPMHTEFTQAEKSLSLMKHSPFRPVIRRT